MMYRRKSTANVSLILICIIGLSVTTPTATLTRGQSVYTTYLPMVVTPPPELNGFVTYQGQPIAGVPIHLLACHSYYRFGKPCFYFRMSTTNSDGQYNFTQVPTLPSPTWLVVESYKVCFESGDLTSPLADVFAWLELPDVYEYTSGAKVQAGDFDILAPRLLTPSSGARLPQSSGTATTTLQFHWIPRDTAPLEGYAVVLHSQDANDIDDASAWSGYLGHTNTYSVELGYSPTCEPYRLCPTSTYAWSIQVYDLETQFQYGATQVYTFTVPLR